VRPAGGGFSPPVAISAPAPFSFRPVPALDASGNGAVVWAHGDELDDIVQIAGYDALPPQLTGVSIPSQATVGQTIGLSAAASDFWGVAGFATSFGDGAQAAGPLVSHAYSAPGAYPVAMTVTDGGGRTTTSSGTILVKARNSFTIGALKLNRGRGTARLAVTVPEPGTVTATARGLKRASASAAAAGSVTLLLKPTGRAMRRLRRSGALIASLNVSYLPVGGDQNSERRRITLKKWVPRR
jgi:hypothetical protein